MAEKEIPDWERIQKKTFTKWVNTHLNKAYGASGCIQDVLTDWESGINLIRLIYTLYKENDKNPDQKVTMPVLKEKELQAKQRIQKVTNLNTALDMMKKAGVAMRGVGAENLVDHGDKDKPVILGMVFTIILDYASRGFGGAASEVKRALLEWVNKKTQNYENVNPPGIKGFTKEWRSGLAWCALIHKHRPDLLDYQACLSQTNAQNLELAFSVADEQLGIPRLLDVEDCDTDGIDEKSVITYTMEYFFRFASEGQKEASASQAAEWLKFLRDVYARQHDYERRARQLVSWTESSRQRWVDYDFGHSIEDATRAFNSLRDFLMTEKPPQEGEKMDLEALYAEIQTTLKVNGMAPYSPPEDVAPEQIEKAMGSLNADQNAYGSRVRENRFRFIEKKHDHSGEELVETIKASFNHYDSSNNNLLSRTEFQAACMEMGVALKSQEEKDALFDKVAEGGSEISFEQYFGWMKARMVVTLDDPDSVRGAFSTMSDGKAGLSEGDLHWLSEEDQAFVRQYFSQNEGMYDYKQFVTNVMGH